MTPIDGTSGALDARPALAVREAVARHLLEAGWQHLAADTVGPVDSGGFSIAVSEEFSVVVWVTPGVSGGTDEPPGLRVVGLAGLDYLPARTVTNALVGRSYSTVTLKEPRQTFSLQRGSDADRATEALTRFATEMQVWLRGDADIEHVVAMLAGGSALATTRPTAVLDEPPTRHGEDHSLVVATLFATSRRFDAARRQLSALTIAPGDLAARRASRQLSRWIDSEGTLKLPQSPAQWGAPEQGRRGPEGRRGWSDYRQLAIAQRQSVESVGPLCGGKGRDEIRALLEDEFEKRELRSEPERLERDIDVLLTEQEPFGKLRLAARGLRGLAALVSDSGAEGGGLARVLADAPAEEEEIAAEQRALPERAAYPVTPRAIKRSREIGRVCDEDSRRARRQSQLRGGVYHRQRLV